jgi:Nucleotidyl transferase AbiEii toxin, Type IV TA system
MKDFYDIWFLSKNLELDKLTLAEAMQETFKRRETTLPSITPIALTEAFSQDATKQMQWKAFLRKNRLDEKINLDEVAKEIEEFLMPVIASIESTKK